MPGTITTITPMTTVMAATIMALTLVTGTTTDMRTATRMAMVTTTT